MLERRERIASGTADDLGDAVMIAKIDEQDSAMIALTVDPARKLNPLAHVGLAQLCASMSPVCVHRPRL
jgi:hypothetical protein